MRIWENGEYCRSGEEGAPNLIPHSASKPASRETQSVPYCGLHSADEAQGYTLNGSRGWYWAEQAQPVFPLLVPLALLPWLRETPLTFLMEKTFL